MNSRLLRFLEAENISQAQFADTLGVARAGISHILSGRNKPGFDFIERLALKYPNLNIEWLITGRGKMYRDSQAQGSLPFNEPSVQAAAAGAGSQEIEKIIVFFSDGTLREFK